MNIESIVMENISGNMRKDLCRYFDWDNIDLHYTIIDLNEKRVYAVSSDYEWQLTYWENDLDLHLSERIYPGLQYWSNYSDVFKKALCNLKKNDKKIDICCKFKDVYEIFSVNSTNKISMSDMVGLYYWRPMISDYAHHIWRENPDAALPLRNEIRVSDEVTQAERELIKIADIDNYVRFGNIAFSYKEMITIHLLLAHRTVKQISVIQGTGENIEEQRIEGIKHKLNCSHANMKELLHAMDDNGINIFSVGSFLKYI